MSRTVHYKGKLTPVVLDENQTTEEFAKAICDATKTDFDLNQEYVDNYYKGKFAKYLADEHFDDYIYVVGTLFTYTKDEIDPYDELANATLNEDGTIDYEVMYHNGGAGFDEMIEESFERNKIKL